MDDNIQQIKEFLEHKTEELQQEINAAVDGILPEELTVFESELYSDYKYHEDKYFDEEIFKSKIEGLFGCFPIDSIFSEVRNYVRKYVYIKALYEYIVEKEL